MCSKCDDPEYIVAVRPLWLTDLAKWHEIKAQLDQRFRELIASPAREYVAKGQGGEVAADSASARAAASADMDARIARRMAKIDQAMGRRASTVVQGQGGAA